MPRDVGWDRPLPEFLHPAALRLGHRAHEPDVRVLLNYVRDPGTLRRLVLALLATEDGSAAAPQVHTSDNRPGSRAAAP